MWTSTVFDPSASASSCQAARAMARRVHHGGSASHQNFQEGQLGGRESRRLRAADGDVSRDSVELEIGHPNGQGLHRLATTLQRSDTSQQLTEVEGLDQIVVCALVQAGHPVCRCVAGGEHEDRQRRSSASYALDHLEPAHLGHSPVEDGHLVVVRVEVAQRLFAVDSCIHHVAILTQPALEHRTQTVIVLGDQHPHGPCLPLVDDERVTAVAGARHFRVRPALYGESAATSCGDHGSYPGCPLAKNTRTMERSETDTSPTSATRLA